jgi:hypothetical protein
VAGDDTLIEPAERISHDNEGAFGVPVLNDGGGCCGRAW